MRFYIVEMLGTVVFAVTGVLAVRRQGIDVIAALFLGVITAIGGGTIRDVVLNVPPFWVRDFNYLWAAACASVGAFFLSRPGPRTSRLLLYLDALGVALFTIAAANKVLALGFGPGVAVVMGLVTGIGGGLLRDVLAHRPTLLMSREIYATPILIGCTLYVLLRETAENVALAGPLAMGIIFGFRTIVIYRNLKMPEWLRRAS